MCICRVKFVVREWWGLFDCEGRGRGRRHCEEERQEMGERREELVSLLCAAGRRDGPITAGR